jgi:hypothetical protein
VITKCWNYVNLMCECGVKLDDVEFDVSFKCQLK